MTEHMGKDSTFNRKSLIYTSNQIFKPLDFPYNPNKNTYIAFLSWLVPGPATVGYYAIWISVRFQLDLEFRENSIHHR